MAELGDLTDFLKEGSAVSNLDWLDVDENRYRELDTLPKQNLDIAPELEALWRHKDEPASNFVPNTGAPKTMGDMSELHGRLRSASEDAVRTARLAIMQTTDPQRIRSILASRYDTDTLTYAKTALSSVFAERGLLGRIYVAAEDFPQCSRGSKSVSEFVRKYALEAKYVVMKTACGDCSHRHVQPNGSSHCGVFHKELQVEVPYSDVLASEVERREQAKGKAVQASIGTPRDRIQKACLAETPNTSGYSGHMQSVSTPTKADTQQILIAAENLTKKRDVAERQKLAAIKARPVIALLRREMLKGRSEGELAHALRMAFDPRDLQETMSEWGPLYKQAGLFGAVYMTQDSFDDCREGADFVNKHASKVRAVVAGSKCGSCIFNQASRCMMYGRKLVASTDEVLTEATVVAVVDEHKIAGRLPFYASKMTWGSTPEEALKAIHTAASTPVGGAPESLRSTIEKGFHGASRQVQTGEITKRKILKEASKYMNEGLYGEDLKKVLQGSFDPRDLIATSEELKVILAEQGLQGIKYVDPTVYDDYGKGCKEASRLHRSRSAVQYLKVGSKCGSCVHQTRPGFCSVISKQLVVEPPYIDKLAEQRAVLASGSSTYVSEADIMRGSGLSMMQEYELQHRESSVEFAPEARRVEATIEFGAQKVKL